MSEKSLEQVATEQLQLAGGTQAPTQPVVGHVLWTPDMVQHITLALLIFTFLVLAMASVLLYKKDQWGLQTLRVFGIILIISLSSVLLVVGYSNEQLTPIVGLFGAIAGYLLGRNSSPPTSSPAVGGSVPTLSPAPRAPVRRGPQLPANPE